MAAGKDVIPQAELAVIVDMPAELLRRRPDVRAAEMQLAAQSALIGVRWRICIRRYPCWDPWAFRQRL
jgi:hypothetical protein